MRGGCSGRAGKANSKREHRVIDAAFGPWRSGFKTHIIIAALTIKDQGRMRQGWWRQKKRKRLNSVMNCITFPLMCMINYWHVLVCEWWSKYWCICGHTDRIKPREWKSKQSSALHLYLTPPCSTAAQSYTQNDGIKKSVCCFSWEPLIRHINIDQALPWNCFFMTTPNLPSRWTISTRHTWWQL